MATLEEVRRLAMVKSGFEKVAPSAPRPPQTQPEGAADEAVPSSLDRRAFAELGLDADMVLQELNARKAAAGATVNLTDAKGALRKAMGGVSAKGNVKVKAKVKARAGRAPDTTHLEVGRRVLAGDPDWPREVNPHPGRRYGSLPYILFVSPCGRPDAVVQFGKYRQAGPQGELPDERRTISRLAQDHPGYLRWILKKHEEEGSAFAGQHELAALCRVWLAEAGVVI